MRDICWIIAILCVCGVHLLVPTINMVLKALGSYLLPQKPRHWEHLMEQSNVGFLKITLVHCKELKGGESGCWSVYKEAISCQEPGIWAWSDNRLELGCVAGLQEGDLWLYGIWVGRKGTRDCHCIFWVGQWVGSHAIHLDKKYWRGIVWRKWFQTWKMLCKLQREGNTQKSYTAAMPVNHYDDQHGTTTLTMQ